MDASQSWDGLEGLMYLEFGTINRKRKDVNVPLRHETKLLPVSSNCFVLGPHPDMHAMEGVYHNRQSINGGRELISSRVDGQLHKGG